MTHLWTDGPRIARPRRSAAPAGAAIGAHPSGGHRARQAICTAVGWPIDVQGLDDAELVERAMQIRRVAIDAERAGRCELVPTVPAREQAHTQHPGTPRREQVPHGITDHVAVADVDAELLLAFQKE